MYESRYGIGRILQFVGSPSFYDDLSLSIGQQYISGSEGESGLLDAQSLNVTVAYGHLAGPRPCRPETRNS